MTKINNPISTLTFPKKIKGKGAITTNDSPTNPEELNAHKKRPIVINMKPIKITKNHLKTLIFSICS